MDPLRGAGVLITVEPTTIAGTRKVVAQTVACHGEAVRQEPELSCARASLPASLKALLIVHR
jgi:hypothetical protein